MTKTNKIFEIPEYLSGQRIDSALTEILDEISRSKIKTCLQDGRVTAVSYTHLTLPTKA